MNVSGAGVDLIKKFEDCSLDAYLDMVGVVTIGWGTTGPDIHMGLSWTQEDCDKVLLADLDHFASQISKLITAQVNQNQFDACCSFTYNLGVGAFRSSTLLKLINQNAFLEAASEFHKWDHAGGREVPGLLKRRLAEKTLFLS